MTGLKKEDYATIRHELDNCKKPLFLFHDDSDGLCSFLLLYRYCREGKGMPVKTARNLDFRFFRHLKEYAPDKLFILDIPAVDQRFMDQLNIPTVYIDHHPYNKLHKVRMFNPLIYDKKDNTCVTRLCYDAVQNEDDLWLAVLGSISDWQMPQGLLTKFRKKYPDLLPAKVKRPEEAIFDTKLGELIRIYNFALKGARKDVIRDVKILTRIKDPYELLKAETPRSKLLLKRFKKIYEEYNTLKEYALNQVKKDKVLLVKFGCVKISFTGELANELLYRYPKKMIFVTRESEGRMISSLRTSTKSGINLQPIVEKALQGIEGYGGGHEHACGAVIKKEDFERFFEQVKEQIE